MESAREEIRRVLMGYDVDTERGEKLAAFLEASLPDDLSESFRWELAAVRHELGLFADIERLFSRAPLPRPTGEAGPSSRAILLDAVRRYREGGGWLPEGFRTNLLSALAHYGVAELAPSEALERALLRLLASQAAPELRRRLVLGCLARVHALAASGLSLGDDHGLDDVLERIAGLRGHVSDAIADLSLEARYAIFEGPRLESQAERTTKEVESWLAAAEAVLTHPPESVLAHLAGSPRAVFDRVGRWLSDPDPRRRAIAVAAHVRRLYAHQRPLAHTSGVVGPVHVERLDLAGDRIVLGSVASPSDLAPTLERLGRAASAAAVRAPSRRVDAIELLVPITDEEEVEGVAEAITPLLGPALTTQRLTLTLLPSRGRARCTSRSSTRPATARRRCARTAISTESIPRPPRGSTSRACASSPSSGSRRPRICTASTRAARRSPATSACSCSPTCAGARPTSRRRARPRYTSPRSSATSSRPRAACAITSSCATRAGGCSGTA